MPLIPKVPFVSGAVFTPEVATEMTGITFDDQPTYYGHFNKISDEDLSDDVGAIKNRVATLSTNLKVSAGTGLNANYAAGKLLYGTTLFNIGASSVALSASTTNYVYGSSSGTILATASQPPIIRALLATVTTNTTGVVSVTDYREGVSVEAVRPFTLSVRNFGGRGDQGNFTAVGNEILSDGEYYYNNFTVPLGVTITVNRLGYIYCSGNVNVAGTIIVSPASQGGGGVIPQLANTCIPGQGLGAGTNERLPYAYSFRSSPIGSGGSSGFAVSTVSSSFLTVNNTSPGGAGGEGGGGVIFEAAGTITVTGSILANGTAGAVGRDFDNGTVRYSIGGGGGGSGGSITLKSLGALIVSGTLSANGGAGGGGTPGNTQVSAEGGSGGGGGIITIQSPGINTTGSILSANGGAAGSPGSILAVPYKGFGGVGGSYGGLSGQIVGDGGAGNVGIIRTQAFSPIG